MRGELPLPAQGERAAEFEKLISSATDLTRLSRRTQSIFTSPLFFSLCFYSVIRLTYFVFESSIFMFCVSFMNWNIIRYLDNLIVSLFLTFFYFSEYKNNAFAFCNSMFLLSNGQFGVSGDFCADWFPFWATESLSIWPTFGNTQFPSKFSANILSYWSAESRTQWSADIPTNS